MRAGEKSFLTSPENWVGANVKAIPVGNNGEMEGSEGWERIPDFYEMAGDIQTKAMLVSAGTWTF
jgi:hypothetical protein